jgi:phage gp46-like protein
MVNKAIPAAAQNIKLTQANEYPQEMLQWLYEASAINSILQQ